MASFTTIVVQVKRLQYRCEGKRVSGIIVQVFDKSGCGYITPSDLRAVLQCMGEELTEEEIDEMIAEVDIDGDGRIDFEEFITCMRSEDDDTDDDDNPTIEEDEEDMSAFIKGDERTSYSNI